MEQARKEGYQQGYRGALAAAETAYKQERERLKATGEATQHQYQQLKAEFEKTKLELAKLKEPPTKPANWSNLENLVGKSSRQRPHPRRSSL